MTAGASLSADLLYRYDLVRTVELARQSPGRSCLFVMLNPSTADATHDDHTVRCCRRLTLREGCTTLHVVNLYAYRTTSPKVLVASWRAGVDIIGPDTDVHLRRILTAGHAFQRPDPLVVVAWGARPSGLDPEFHGQRIADVYATLATATWCLGRTLDGSPRHPSRLATDVELVPWAP